MNCPGCNNRCDLDGKYYKCRSCGAFETKNITGEGTMWIRSGRVIAAPEAVKESLDQAKSAWPDGKFGK